MQAGCNRSLSAVFLGTVVIACACLIILFSVLSARADADADDHLRLLYIPYVSRTARLASNPVLWLGFLTLLAGLQGVCILIFLFGDVRQLHAYELAKPKISPPMNPRLQPPPARLGGRRASRGRGDLGEDKLSRARGSLLVLSKAGEIEIDDDGHSLVLKSGALAGTESGTSLDKPQDGHGLNPAPPHANANAPARPRISVDITQRSREGSVDVVDITLARTVEEDVYGVYGSPQSDTIRRLSRASTTPPMPVSPLLPPPPRLASGVSSNQPIPVPMPMSSRTASTLTRCPCRRE
jgi:hypothetical protein